MDKVLEMAMEDIFNPSEYTEKELLKLVYRELHNLRTEFDDYRKNNTTQKELAEQAKRIVQLETEMAINKKLQDESEKRQQRNMIFVGVLIAGLEIILKFVIK